ncbi:MAG: hypothetical protein HFI86_03485 [Bacilli bacterium]|nr:hypothetical protein [Bacilli bacterium]
MRILKRVAIIFLVYFAFISNAKAEEKVKLYLFHNYDCPHCAEEKLYLKELEQEYDNLEIITYEVKKDEENREMLKEFLISNDWDIRGVPLTVIGTNYFIGYNDDIGIKIRCAINYYSENEHRDLVGEFLGTSEVRGDLEDNFDPNSCKFKIPIIGEVNPKNISLPLASIVIGLVDGFNPCAMWVLIFLISLMIGMKNRKRMWCLGIAFLLSSAIVYFAFMYTWINVTGMFTSTKIIEILVSIVALLGGGINLYHFIKEVRSKDVGCSVTNNAKKKKIMLRAKEIVTENSFLLALGGVIVLAVSVNIIELACSAGLPILFAQILAMNDLSNTQILFYNIIYIIFFLIDDLVVFIIAMTTMKLTGISNKYNKYAHLIGGLIMVGIGILMIFFPNLLKFNF